MAVEILTFTIHKGGTGKTTTAAAIAQAAVRDGKKVLAIDLDPQGNLTYQLGVQRAREGGSYGLITKGLFYGDVLETTEKGLDVIPTSWNLSAITSGQGTAQRLKKALAPAKKVYDLIVIDTPPTMGELQYNALQAATGIIIPLEADAFSINALGQLLTAIKPFKQTNRRLQIKGVLVARYDGRSTLRKQMLEQIKNQVDILGLPYLGTIRNGIAVSEAATMKQSLFDYAPKSKPAQDYIQVYKKLFSTNNK